jgi:hypothetical protein
MEQTIHYRDLTFLVSMMRFMKDNVIHFDLKSAITFDASSSYLPTLNSSSSYYFKFEIGALVIQTIGNSRVTRVLSAGKYDVSLSINDQPFSSYGSIFYGVTKGGK